MYKVSAHVAINARPIKYGKNILALLREKHTLSAGVSKEKRWEGRKGLKYNIAWFNLQITKCSAESRKFSAALWWLFCCRVGRLHYTSLAGGVFKLHTSWCFVCLGKQCASQGSCKLAARDKYDCARAAAKGFPCVSDDYKSSWNLLEKTPTWMHTLLCIQWRTFCTQNNTNHCLQLWRFKFFTSKLRKLNFSDNIKICWKRDKKCSPPLLNSN